MHAHGADLRATVCLAGTTSLALAAVEVGGGNSDVVSFEFAGILGDFRSKLVAEDARVF